MNQSFDDTASLNDSLPHNIDFSPTSVKIRAKNLKYQGDPDLHPIRSNENAFLVRVLYHLAQKINEMVSISLQTLFINAVEILSDFFSVLRSISKHLLPRRFYRKSVQTNIMPANVNLQL